MTPTSMSSPLDTPLNLTPSITDDFSEAFARTLAREHAEGDMSAVSADSNAQGTGSSSGLRGFELHDHVFGCAASWRWASPSEHNEQCVSDEIAFSYGNSVSHHLDTSTSTEVPDMPVDPEFLGTVHASRDHGRPEWQHSATNCYVDEAESKIPNNRWNVQRRDVLTHRGFRSNDGPMPRSPALRTTTPIQIQHRLQSDQKAVATIIPGSRVAHNIVEKQYRTRLNDHFTSLLDSIPVALIGSTINSARRPDGSERKVSKSEVLILAKRRIELLEKAVEETEHENKRLRGKSRTVAEVRGQTPE